MELYLSSGLSQAFLMFLVLAGLKPRLCKRFWPQIWQWPRLVACLSARNLNTSLARLPNSTIFGPLARRHWCYRQASQLFDLLQKLDTEPTRMLVRVKGR